MLFSLIEVLDIAITALAASFIFMNLLEPIRTYDSFGQKLLLTGAVVVPAIVFHEFGHKFLALGLGYDATFHAAYWWLGIGIVLKLISFPFLFVVPAYVVTIGAVGLDRAWIALAGPLVNLFLWAVCYAWLKLGKHNATRMTLLHFSAQINLFLFLFNMLPIPSFDGYTFWTGIVGIF
jgi:Zn-dependent protease